MTSSEVIKEMLSDLHERRMALIEEIGALGELSNQLYIDLIKTLQAENADELAHIEVEQDLQQQEEERVTNKVR